MKSKIGLTLGKFAPFHMGHKYVIDTAISEMDKVYIMSYDDMTTAIPLCVRSGWIRQIYKDNPNVEIIECYNSPKETGYTPEIMALHDQYILKTVGEKGITHFYSSEHYGNHVSKALNAVDRRVDMNRTTYPVSSTMIRENAYRNVAFIPDVVYRDLITKVVFLGSECSGKSTITKALADKFNTAYMLEYGAEYWLKNQKDGILTPKQMVTIAQGHIKLEDSILLQSNEYCFVDTNALTTCMYAKDYHGYALPELETLADKCYRRYDLTFLCEIDIPYDDTWDRRGVENREMFQKKIIGDLINRKVPFIRLRGSLEKRIIYVEKVLSSFNKWDSR